MQEYLLKNSFREKMDALGFHGLVILLCCCFFVLLWGVRLQAMLAAAGLYGLCLLIRHKTRDRRLHQKEQKLRRRIGGELLLEDMLFFPPDKAHFEAALHLSLAEGLTLERMTKNGVLCRQSEKILLLSFVQSTPGCTLTPGDVLQLQRAAWAEKAEALWLCVPCAISGEAKTQGERKLPVRFIQREQLIRLFGAAAPATDRQLVALGKEKKKALQGQNLWHIIFRREKARRYAAYGGLLLFLYVLTGLPYYALPGLLCAFLAAISRCFHAQ